MLTCKVTGQSAARHCFEAGLKVSRHGVAKIRTYRNTPGIESRTAERPFVGRPRVEVVG